MREANLSKDDLRKIDQAWENHKAAVPVAVVVNDNQPGSTAIIQILVDPPTLVVGTQLYAGPKMIGLGGADDNDALDAIFWKQKYIELHAKLAAHSSEPRS